MRAVRSLAVLALVLAGVVFTATGADALSSPLQSLTLVSRAQLAPGVEETHWHARVSGVGDVQDVYQVSWKLGDASVGLHAALMGGHHANGSIDIRPISGWASLVHPAGLLAAMNGDFFSWTSGTTATPSGMLIQRRHLYEPGAGGAGGVPSVGFMPNGRMVFGRPKASPVRFLLPGGHTATIAAFGSVAGKSDQVDVYAHAGARVAVPPGYLAVIARSSFRGLITGSAAFTNASGLGVAEHASAFTLADAGTVLPTTAVALAAVARTATRVTVPGGSSVLLMDSPGIAAAGFRALLAGASPSVRVTTSEAAWAPVTDVVSGKPQVVTNGRPLLTKPADVTDDQWYPEQFRPAIATSADGHGWLVIIGSVNGGNGTSLTGSQFSRVLVALGARNALQFDNRHSTELFVPSQHNGMCVAGPGACHTLYPHYERAIPDAIALTYR